MRLPHPRCFIQVLVIAEARRACSGVNSHDNYKLSLADRGTRLGKDLIHSSSDFFKEGSLII